MIPAGNRMTGKEKRVGDWDLLLDEEDGYELKESYLGTPLTKRIENEKKCYGKPLTANHDDGYFINRRDIPIPSGDNEAKAVT